MLPVLFLISVASFTIINLPPGDFLTVRMLELRARGDVDAERRMAHLTERFGLDRPLYNWNPGEYAFILKEHQSREKTWKEKVQEWLVY